MVAIVIGPLLLFFLPVHARSQTLEIGSASVERGSANISRVVLKPKTDRAVVALQFDLVFPPALTIQGTDVVTGDAADSAGKSIHCAVRRLQAKENVCTCILAGGQGAFQAGTVAIVKISAAADAPPGAVKLQLEKAKGVTPAMESVPIGNAQATITIR
jgi:hypothetical protein